MKPSYLAAALAAVVSLSGTAHAAFNGTIEDLGVPPSVAGPVPINVSGTLVTDVSGDLPSAPTDARDPYRGTPASAGSGEYHVLGGGTESPTFPFTGEYVFAKVFPTFQIHWGFTK